MSKNIESTNLVEDEVFEESEAAFPPAPPISRPTAFKSSVQQPELPLPRAEGTPLRENRLKLAHRTEGLRTIVLAFGVFSFGITVALAIELVTGGPPVPPHGGVSSKSEKCSNIGVEQLKKGGNAVDAAISAMLCIGLVRAQSAGLGGGGLMIVHDHKNHNTTLLDFRETAPKRLTASSQEALTKGGASVGVPGELAGMAQAHALYGRLPWSELFVPVIKLAEEGWLLDSVDEMDLRRRGDDLRVDNEGYVQFRQTFLAGAGQWRMRRKDLADVFRRLAVDRQAAVDLFYKGELASEIAETVRKNGGVMDVDDLNGYAVKLREPLLSTFHDYNVITFPAPSSGSLLVHSLNELEKLERADTVDVANYYAKVAEITRNAFKCRALLGDPSDKSVYSHEQVLINKTADVDQYCDQLTKAPPDDHGTSHINVIDNDELMVSVTSTLNYWYGSMLMTRSGILLNNEMADFDFGPSNAAVGGSRPLSSMVPSIVYHKRNCLQRMTIGGTNGTKITPSVAQTLLNLILNEVSLETAVESPKIFCGSAECILEDFAKAQEVAQAITERVKLPVTVVKEKISSVSVLVKLNSTLDGYIEKHTHGKAVTY